jgi:hypothetical protein
VSEFDTVATDQGVAVAGTAAPLFGNSPIRSGPAVLSTKAPRARRAVSWLGGCCWSWCVSRGCAWLVGAGRGPSRPRVW